MKSKNIIKHTDFSRNIKKFEEKIKNDDVIVVKNNEVSFIAVQPSRYEEMINTMEEYLEGLGDVVRIVRENKEELIKTYKIKHITVFGSVANGKQTDESDLDILYESDLKGLSSFGPSKFIDKLFKRTTNSIPKNACKKDFLESIEGHSIAVF